MITAKFIKAGKATFTVQNIDTGNRFTYRVKRAGKKDIWFVSLLSGPDNTNDYSYMGCLFSDNFRSTSKSKVKPDAKSFQAFKWTWDKVKRDSLPENVEIHHCGKCGRCGRKLTVPESIQSGFGPECVKHVH